MNDLMIPLSELPELDIVGLALWTGQAVGEMCVHVLDHDGDDDPLVYDGRWRARESWWLRGDGPADVVWHVSLGDSDSRDRCLRWLAARVGLKPWTGAPGWHRACALGRKSWELWNVDALDMRWFSAWDKPKGAKINVPALAELAYTDDTLADGASLYDALALAVVLRHVGGAE